MRTNAIHSMGFNIDCIIYSVFRTLTDSLGCMKFWIKMKLNMPVRSQETDGFAAIFIEEKRERV